MNPLIKSPSQLSPLLFDSGQCARFDYEPGNGTRYELLLAWLEEPDQTQVLTVSLLNFRTCYVFGFPPVPSYLMEKLRLSRGDAEPLAELIGELIRRKQGPGSPEQLARWQEAVRLRETTLGFRTWIANNPQP